MEVSDCPVCQRQPTFISVAFGRMVRIQCLDSNEEENCPIDLRATGVNDEEAAELWEERVEENAKQAQ